MTCTLSLTNFAARLRGLIEKPASLNVQEGDTSAIPFDQLARELFALQVEQNAAYGRFCRARGVSPAKVSRWEDVPAVPASGFKEFELSCLPKPERSHVFHSSGTTGQLPSRHFHNADSLALYAASIMSWFRDHGLIGMQSGVKGPCPVILTPPPSAAPHSSLVFMFETIRQALGEGPSAFVGEVAADATWAVDLKATLTKLEITTAASQPVFILGTAFSFVHLLDHMALEHRRLQLPPGSRVLETGGYKGRSRCVPKTELHRLITEILGVRPDHIICEYGMSELSSQAYDSAIGQLLSQDARLFRFPPWARAQIISPETGTVVAEGDTGLLRIFDLANAYSVMAVQTGDLAIRRGSGFELLGRDAHAEPRGCSLMAGVS